MGWILSYFIFSLVGLINYYPFEEFTNSYYPVLSFVAIVAINYVILRVDIRKGIERISKIGVLLLMVIIIPLTILGVLMPGSDRGIDFYLKPDFSKLSDPNIWSVAFGQAFFSLSIGLEFLLHMEVIYDSNSYNNNNKKRMIKLKGLKERQLSLVTLSSIVIISDISIAFLAGLMIFSFVFANNMDPTHGTSLVFRVMPAVFSNIGEDYGSIIIAPLFFFLLLLAGITSSISMLQVPVSSFQNSLNMNKNKAALVISLLVLAFGMPSALSYSYINLTIVGTPFLDIIDFLFSTYGLAIAAAVFAILVTWFMDKKITCRVQ